MSLPPWRPEIMVNNSYTHQHYILISRQAWNIFLKYQLIRGPNSSKRTHSSHDKSDALVKNNHIALRQRPGIEYHNSHRLGSQDTPNLHPSHQKPTGLEWTCIGKIKPTAAYIHGSQDPPITWIKDPRMGREIRLDRRWDDFLSRPMVLIDNTQNVIQ